MSSVDARGLTLDTLELRATSYELRARATSATGEEGGSETRDSTADTSRSKLKG
jgi:hypothetical protein